MTTEPAEWSNAKLALTLLSIDPAGLGGVWLRARVSPVRDRFIAAIAPSLGDRVLHRLHPNVTDDQLFGGLDLAATLDAGKTVMTSGLLNTGRDDVLLLSMAERCEAGLAARIATALDSGTGHSLVALDEGIDEEELPAVLQDRVAFHLDFQGLTLANCHEILLDADRIAIAQKALPRIKTDPDIVPQISQAALHFGIDSLRAPIFVLRAARAIAAIQRADAVEMTHLATAMALIFGPRATVIPDTQPEEDTQAPSEPTDSTPDSSKREAAFPQDMVLDAIAANLPKGLLDKLAAAKAGQQASGGSGSGDVKKGNRRGRPKPPRRGRLGGAARVDLIATLRAAAPWQPMRRKAAYAADTRIQLRSADIRLKQFEEKSDRLLIFAVDASGSSALARLSEAKGAVELLLAEAYARRDHVALIAFRGDRADVLLPPTRSLVQTKRRLAAMPGGGGTPLASGLQAALNLADATRSKGLTPTIAILTDGRANIALDGTASRMMASEDARSVARLVRARQTAALVIDTGTRPQKALQELAAELSAPYLPLPRADAQRVSDAIGAMLE